MFEKTNTYLRPLCFSIVLHAFFLGFLGLHIDSFRKIPTHFLQKTHKMPSTKSEPVKIIQAIALDERAVLEEIQRLEDYEQKALLEKQTQKNQLFKEKKALAKVKAAAELAKKQAEKQQKSMKLEQEKLAKATQQARQEQAKIATLKKEAEIAHQKAKALKAKIEQEKKLAAQRVLAEKEKILEEKLGFFISQLQDKIEENRQLMLHLPKETSVTVSFYLSPQGHVRNLKILKSSGHVVYDEHTLTAIRKIGSFEDILPEEEVLKRYNRMIRLDFKNEHGA